MGVANKLKIIILDKGITYSRISEKTGIPINLISKSLRGTRKLKADELIVICKAIEIDINDLDKIA